MFQGPSPHFPVKTNPIFLTSSPQQDTHNLNGLTVCLQGSHCSVYIKSISGTYCLLVTFKAHYSVFFRYQTYRGGSVKIIIFETMFTCTNLLICQSTLSNLYKENHAFSYQYLICIYHLSYCCRHFILAVWLTTLLSICKFHNSFQCEELCPLVSKHLHQACFEGSEPVDRQNRCSPDNYVRSHFTITILYISVVSPMHVTCPIYL